MATLDHRLVSDELRVIRSSSNAIKAQLKDALLRMERDPASFPKLDDAPPSISRRADVCLRKAKLINQKHDFRIIFAHWTFDQDDFPGREDHVAIILAFPRRDDYQINWEGVGHLLPHSM